MNKISIYDLIKTTNDLIINLITRIDELLDEFRYEKRQDIFCSDRILFMLEDFAALAESIDIISQQNSSISLEEFMEKLNLLYESIKIKDNLLFKDILEFEISPLLQHWDQVIKFTGQN